MRLIIGAAFQGKEKYASVKYGTDIVIYRDLYSDILDYVQMQLSFDEINSKIEDKINESDVVIALEAYNGLSPIDANKALFVEYYGRILNRIAERAESVERVVCGLAITLK